MMINRIKEKLFAPISIHSLVFVRIAFGLIMFVDIAKYFYFDSIDYLYINPLFHFKYYGFDWVTTLPSNLIYLLFVTLGVLALLIAIGLFYRVASALFLLGFTYIFLLDQAYYLNHYYMIILFNFLLCFMPANRYLAVDSFYLNPAIKTKTIPAWPVILLKIQMEIILIYAGIVKINPDWLQFYPLKFWFSTQGEFFSNLWVIAIASYGSILLHVLGAPLLLIKQTRIWIFLIYAAFHSINSYIFTFDIGIFPWITLALTTIFFAPNWPVQFLDFFKNLRNLKFSFRSFTQIYQKSSSLKDEISETKNFKISSNKKNLIVFLIIIWAVFQIVFPLRKLLYPGNSAWTKEGYYFSWQMKLNHTTGNMFFLVKDSRTNQCLNNCENQIFSTELRYLTFKQAKEMGCKPYMIRQYANFLKKVWAKKVGHDNIAIYTITHCSLNGRKSQFLIDRNTDLAKEKESFGHAKWILPLDEKLKPGQGN